MKEYLTDFIAYNVDSDKVETISDGNKKDGSQGQALLTVTHYPHWFSIECTNGKLSWVRWVNLTKT